MSRLHALALAFALTAMQALAAPQMAVHLTPGPIDAAVGRSHVGVRLTFTDVDVSAGKPLLTLPIIIANTETVATTLTALTASDALGPIPLTVEDDPPALAYSRRWITGRAVKGEVAVSYQAPVDNTPPRRGSGPPYALRTEGGGVSGVGNTFILLPVDGPPMRISLTWDLSALGSATTAMSSHGEGNVTLPEGPAGRLHRTLFMAGPMRREPASIAATGFSAAWLGHPPFDPRPLMSWAGQLHSWMSGFFGDTTAPPYRVILRYNPINAGGGAALDNSFLLTWGETAKDPEGLKGTLSHEMIHTWTAFGLGGQWYGEGIAVHYQALLPLRAGLMTPEQYLDDINDTARRYYTNALNRTPDAEIAPRFWEDTRIRTLPYDRGAMYFAVLGGKIRRASDGARSLDDLIREMVRRRRAGEATSEAGWVDLVAAELGDVGRTLHADMLAGRLMLPESGDFGPCFRQTTGKFRRFELGFEPRSLVGDVKTIRGLIAGSEAARAGLKDGDVVTYAVALDSVQGDQSRTLSFEVTRDGRTFGVTYLPRGETVEAWQWERVPGVPDAACGR
jgi:hypothetical protein